MADRSSARLVSDPLSGREVIFAPGRARRPGAHRASSNRGGTDPGGGDRAASDCPFCEGSEGETPPELFALGAPPGRAPDTPGWKVRVAPNLYPAFARQHVIVHSSAHATSIAELDESQLGLVAAAWAEIADRAWQDGFDHLFVFVNEGAKAGASREHSHSQAVWLDRVPPEIAAESPRLRDGGCALCKLLQELPPELVLARAGEVSLAVSPFGRASYELLIAPDEHLPDGFGDAGALGTALSLAAEGVRRLQAVEGPGVPFNLWLHSFQDDGHWHLELVPRLSEFAGIELGMGVFVNTLVPEEAASRLRGGLEA